MGSAIFLVTEIQWIQKFRTKMSAIAFLCVPSPFILHNFTLRYHQNNDCCAAVASNTVYVTTGLAMVFAHAVSE